LVVANSGDDSVSVILNNGNETFQSRTDYHAGSNPFSVATADFNGDGSPDLAVANSNCPSFPTCGPGTISIVLGNGDGTFQGPVEYSTGTGTDPYSVLVGDFNGDKKPDLAVANYATNTVSILLGNGDGTFQGHVDFPAGGSEPASVATGDVNGDGNLDLVVANFHSNTVSVLLGNGDGTFKPAVTYNVGHGPISVAVADFNGDHKLDLVVVNETDNNASVLLGNGDGTFQPQVAYPTGTGGNPLSVVVGDFNGDHNLDLAIADYTTQQVSVLLGNGDGTFQPVKAYPTGANPSSIVIADFNGDGQLDLALTSTPVGSFPGNVVSLLLGNGDGTFGAPALFGAGYLSYSAAVGDFNRDGTPDLAVANGASNTVSILLNTQGTAMAIQSSANPSVFGQAVTLKITVAASVSNGAAPTGSVTLKDGSALIGSGALVNGQLSLSTSALPVGADSLSAVYSGDSNYQPHTVGLTQTVEMAGSSTVLISSANPSDPKQLVTFTATVTSNTTGQPTGTVNFLDGTATIGSSSVSSSGIAAFSTSTLAVGTHGITAAYGGDGNFTASTSPVLSQVVQQGNTSTALTSSANPSTLSQSVTFTATVSSGGGVAPTGTVQFMDGTTVLGTPSLGANGIVTFSITTLSVGTHSITAVYSGDSNSDPSTSPILSQVVQKAGTTTALSASPTSANLNQSVTFSATVTPGATGVPTGTVNFLDGATQIGTSPLNASGVATFAISTLTAGSHSITAAYSGDGNFNVSTSSVVSLAVTAPGFALSVSALSPSSVAPGKSATSTVTISNVVGGLSPSAVALTCSITPAVSPAPTCSVGTIAVANNTGTSTLTVTAAGPQAALAMPDKPGSGTLLALGLMIPAILLGGAGRNASNRRKMLGFCLACLVLSGCMLQVACGGSSTSNNTPPPSGNTGTPAGVYTITITGTASGAPTQTAQPVSLTVQ
jgi:Bacterial Ig-like domain (group 3)/FG-GAP-like repeat